MWGKRINLDLEFHCFALEKHSKRHNHHYWLQYFFDNTVTGICRCRGEKCKREKYFSTFVCAFEKVGKHSFVCLNVLSDCFIALFISSKRSYYRCHDQGLTQHTFSNHAFNFWVRCDFGSAFLWRLTYFLTKCLIRMKFHQSTILHYVDVSNVICSNVSHSLWNSSVKAIDPFDFSMTVYLPLNMHFLRTFQPYF